MGRTGAAIIFGVDPPGALGATLLVPEVTERDRIYDGLPTLPEARARSTDDVEVSWCSDQLELPSSQKTYILT